jgi:hypothetical protein
MTEPMRIELFEIGRQLFNFSPASLNFLLNFLPEPMRIELFEIGRQLFNFSPASLNFLRTQSL